MRTNVKAFWDRPTTGGGGAAARTSTLQALRRMSLAALLFEYIAYSSGSDWAETVSKLVKEAKPEDVADLAIECREVMYLRHMPLFLVRELARTKGNGRLVAQTLARIIQRPDELTEYLALYWKDKKQPISAGSKRGLAEAFRKFDAATLAKYDQKNAVKLRDILRLTHAKPENLEQSQTWKTLIKGELESPDTWEVALSAGGNKKEVFERLLTEKKLGGLAFLRNLRNMIGAGVDEDLIKARFKGGFKYVLPFRFMSAAQYAPTYESQIEEAMLRTTGDLPKLPGRTVIVVDVSGSMSSALSTKSEMNRLGTAAALSILLREQCEDVRIYCTAGSGYKRIHETALIPARRGMALRDQINAAAGTMGGGGIFLVQCLDWVYGKGGEGLRGVDRLIVLTDEADCDLKLKPEQANTFGKQNYLINISVEKNGVGYGAKWVHIDGWSERVIDFIQSYERGQN